MDFELAGSDCLDILVDDVVALLDCLGRKPCLPEEEDDEEKKDDEDKKEDEDMERTRKAEEKLHYFRTIIKERI